MVDSDVSRLVLLGLLAVVPGAVYAISTGHLVAAIALANVLVIVGSLRIAVSEDVGREGRLLSANGG